MTDFEMRMNMLNKICEEYDIICGPNGIDEGMIEFTKIVVGGFFVSELVTEDYVLRIPKANFREFVYGVNLKLEQKIEDLRTEVSQKFGNLKCMED